MNAPFRGSTLSQADCIKTWVIVNPAIWVPELAPDAREVADGWEIAGFFVPKTPGRPAKHIERKEACASFSVFQRLWHRLNSDIDRITSDEGEALAAAAKMAGLPYDPAPDDPGDEP